MKIIHSQLSRTLLVKIGKQLNKILHEETDLTIIRSRILFKGHLYSLRPVVFEEVNLLGFFDPNYLEIGINKIFLFAKDEKGITDTLRHEIAHFVTWLEHGLAGCSHGSEFKRICKRFGWDADVITAKKEIGSNELSVGSPQKARALLSKIEKLLKLGQSSSSHEAEAAMDKARELMQRHHIETPAVDEQEEMVATRILPSKRSSAKLDAISSILRSFFVYPIINRGIEETYLEIFGNKEDVAVAEYVGSFLDRKLEELWKIEKKENSLSGMRAKNSFFHGVASGYLKRSKKSSSSDLYALERLESHLVRSADLAYPRVGSAKRGGYIDPKAHNLGGKRGRDLEITKGLSSKFKKLLSIGIK